MISALLRIRRVSRRCVIVLRRSRLLNTTLLIVVVDVPSDGSAVDVGVWWGSGCGGMGIPAGSGCCCGC